MVPATSAVAPKKDSVELLLDGMQGPQLDRPRMTPQTDGQAHAAYHAEHLVRAGHTAPGEEPKVVVERRTLPATMKLDRSKVLAAIEQVEAQRRAHATAAVPRPIAPRVVLALMAGLVVVLAVFVVAIQVRTRSIAAAAAAARATAPTRTSVPPAAPTTAPVAANEVAAAASSTIAGAASAGPATAAGVWTPVATAAPAPSAPAAPAGTTSAGVATSNAAPSVNAAVKKPPKPQATSTATGLGEFEPRLR
jgi:hypothetical protein